MSQNNFKGTQGYHTISFASKLFFTLGGLGIAAINHKGAFTARNYLFYGLISYFVASGLENILIGTEASAIKYNDMQESLFQMKVNSLRARANENK